MASDDRTVGGQESLALPEDERAVKSSWLLPALLTGAFGLAGVLAGGVISYSVQSKQVDSERDAVRAQDRKVARGTSRLMNVEFLTRVDAMNAALGPDRYPRARIVLSSRLSAADQRAVASEMAPTPWATIAAASATVGRAQRLLDRHPGEPLSRRDRSMATTYRRMFGRAAAALAAFDK